jgi:hypothetical protein
MWSTWDLLTVASTSEPTGPEEEDDLDFSMDFFELRDPRAMRDFMSACDHCLSGDSDDGHNLDDEGYDQLASASTSIRRSTTETTTSACQETMTPCTCVSRRDPAGAS